MIDKDLLDFYNEMIDDDMGKNIIEMLEKGIEYQDILKSLLGERIGERND